MQSQHLLAVQSWASYLTSLSLSFFTFKMVILMSN